MIRFLLSILFLTTISFASDLSKVDFNKYDKYFAFYAKQYGLNYYLLKSVAVTENFYMDPNLVNHNSNGTRDIGLMQINTIWAKEFGIEEKNLYTIETNIHIAARILYTLINRHGYSWETIGMYHSSTQVHKEKWLKRMKYNVEYLAKYDPKVTIAKKYD